MSRLCERPGCAEPATVAYGFDPAELMVWFAPPRPDGPGAGGICRRHADAMVLPRGWWLDDRRGGDDALFGAQGAPALALVETPAVEADAGSRDRHPSGGRKPSRPRRPKANVALVLDASPAAVELIPSEHDEGPATEAAAVPDGVTSDGAATDDVADGGDGRPTPRDAPGADEQTEPAWTPAFDARDDLGGQLHGTTPLLARAFGNGPVVAPTPSRRRRRPAAEITEES